MATTAAISNISNTTNVYSNFYFCGIPGFCSAGSRITCADVIISQCSSCSIAGGVFLLIAVFLLFFAVVIGNAIIQACFVSSSTMRTKMDYVRLSLSVSDMLTGCQLIAVMIPNIIRTLAATQTQLDLFAIASTDLTKAKVCGWLFNLSFTSSMYHMVAMCISRLVAITNPIKYQTMSNKFVCGLIAAAWVMAVFTAAVPLLPWTSVSYSYFESAFMFLPTRKLNSALQPSAVLILSLVFPYICVTFLLIATVVVLKMKRRKSDLALNRDQNNSSSYKREIRIINTLTIMFLSYTGSVPILSLLLVFIPVPLAVCMTMVNLKLITCPEMGLPTMLIMLLAMCNSLVNVVVYGLREERFRRTVRGIRQKYKCL